jgi:hypothetical protein
MSDVLTRAAAELIDHPPIDPPSPAELRRRVRRRRVRRQASAWIALGAVAAGTVGVWQVARPPSRMQSSAATEPAPGTNVDTSAPTGPVDLQCEPDTGVCNWDRLPVLDGAADIYAGPPELGQPILSANWSESLYCIRLDAAGRGCVAVAGGGPWQSAVSYEVDESETGPVDTVARSEQTFTVQVYTWYTSLTPRDHVESDAERGSVSPAEVRGHDALRFVDGYGADAVVWQERPGVLVIVAVPPERADELLELAEGARRIAGPTEIPMVMSLEPSVLLIGSRMSGSLLAGRVGGRWCIGLQFPDGCPTELAGLSWMSNTTAGVDAVGAAPTSVQRVRITPAVGEPVLVSPEPSVDGWGTYRVALGIDVVVTVEWLDSQGSVIASGPARDRSDWRGSPTVVVAPIESIGGVVTLHATLGLPLFVNGDLPVVEGDVVCVYLRWPGTTRPDDLACSEDPGASTMVASVAGLSFGSVGPDVAEVRTGSGSVALGQVDSLSGLRFFVAEGAVDLFDVQGNPLPDPPPPAQATG